MTLCVRTVAVAAALVICMAARSAQSAEAPPGDYQPIPGEPTQLPDEPAPVEQAAPRPDSDGDTYDPDPNRLPGPKHFTPEVCKSAPEVCKARREEMRRRYQDCVDGGRGDCAAPAAEKKPATRKKASKADQTPPPSTQP